jgi:AP-4 complex subunit epsilon-1
MSAALCALFELVSSDVKAFKNLATSFVSILKQVAEHRLPKAYDYRSTPAPFIKVLHKYVTGFLTLETD